MTRRFSNLTHLAAFTLLTATLGVSEAAAQNESILAEVYGRGVHAYYSGNYVEANDYLTSAIDGGTRDPRAYYFRGMVERNQGRTEEGLADWREGARLEARNGGGGTLSIGQSLSRFQGPDRLELEKIRQQARLEAMATATERSDQRLRELGATGRGAVRPAPRATEPAPRAAQPAPPAPGSPVPDNPFADDGPALADGQPEVESDNALEGLDDNPFADDPAPAGDAAEAAMPTEDADPFGNPAPGSDSGADPFGGDPFGGSGDAGDSGDPFGGDPFGN
ncbi:hypothetical protein FYK55_07875 [Roseiconus nitratireducens]|uniref:Uncharacterized protein n=1 Tax=Roseiconus nitratireducens TaxID=2605748 RepID=A0A5M6DDF5_9BACT|nr:hypothetical protein [Roseiconus nitratireducens]KAA5545548.1 hypothetical protein FYK55_07875 [Roseiconus nitratireducens]